MLVVNVLRLLPATGHEPVHDLWPDFSEDHLVPGYVQGTVLDQVGCLQVYSVVFMDVDPESGSNYLLHCVVGLAFPQVIQAIVV